MDDNAKLRLEGHWDELRGRVRETWGKISDDDLERAGGKYDQLIGVIKQRTGESRQVIEQKLEEIAKRR